MCLTYLTNKITTKTDWEKVDWVWWYIELSNGISKVKVLIFFKISELDQLRDDSTPLQIKPENVCLFQCVSNRINWMWIQCKTHQGKGD